MPEMGMPAGTSREGISAECAPEVAAWPGPGAREVWSSVDAGIATARERLGRLARTIEADVIPKLVQLHRESLEAPAAALPSPGAADIEAFVVRVTTGSEHSAREAVDAWRQRGLTVERIFLELFTPTARRLGVMWEDDSADFATVTVGLGRLQRLLRELSQAFGTEVEHPQNGRRVLLCQPDDEQHSFGLAMVAEFFRREGWEVRGGPAGSGIDPVALVRREWFDAIGISVGSERRLDWAASRIAAVRRASRHSGIVVVVGGPIFTLHPEWVDRVGADAAPADASVAPAIAETILSRRASKEV
jgi:methanogenic corrinoid protein MtbC1